MNGTPEDVARQVSTEIATAMRRAMVQAVGAATGALVKDGQPLAGYHVLRQSGLPELEAFEVIEGCGAGGAVLDLLHMPDLALLELSGRTES